MSKDDVQENKSEASQVSSANAFRERREQRDRAEVLTLPSGLVVKAKRPSIMKLIKLGHIPADVASSIQAAANSNGGRVDFAKNLQLLDIFAQHSVIEPQVVTGTANYDAGEISVDDLDDDDKAAILDFAQGGNEEVKSFRK